MFVGTRASTWPAVALPPASTDIHAPPDRETQPVGKSDSIASRRHPKLRL
jgi:hypothetical protein